MYTHIEHIGSYWRVCVCVSLSCICKSSKTTESKPPIWNNDTLNSCSRVDAACTLRVLNKIFITITGLSAGDKTTCRRIPSRPHSLAFRARSWASKWTPRGVGPTAQEIRSQYIGIKDLLSQSWPMYCSGWQIPRNSCGTLMLLAFCKVSSIQRPFLPVTIPACKSSRDCSALDTNDYTIQVSVCQGRISSLCV